MKVKDVRSHSAPVTWTIDAEQQEVDYVPGTIETALYRCDCFL